MSDFNKAFEATIRNEGGYKLHTVKNDRGGQTYAGIARKFWPDWEGWQYIDRNDMDCTELSQLVRGFFYTNFWMKVGGNDISSQIVANDLYDFSVNAGVKIGVKLSQLIIGSVPDGVMGPETLRLINGYPDETFVLKFTIAKVIRYVDIANADKTQRAFLRGWLNRVIGGLS